MRDAFYLAWRYLGHHPLTTFAIFATMTLILYLPAALQVVVESAERHFRSRADSTPLVVGPRGSSLDLVLGSVYFHQPCEQVLRYEQLKRVDDQKLAKTVPVYSKFVTRECPVVGTSDEYFRLRNLSVARGRSVEIHGECLIGHEAARKLDVDPGDRIPVSKSSVFLIDNAPLRLRVVGILGRTESPDDDAIFVDLETTWIIEGLGHAHDPGAKHGEPETQLQTEITRENLAEIHFHGDRNRFPISAIIVLPEDRKSETILLGQYFSPDETAQIVKPRDVIDSMLARVVMVRSYMIALILLVSLVTVLMIGLVFALSVRLRRSEIVTITKMGGSRSTIALMMGSQIAIVFACSLISAMLLTGLTDRYASDLIRLWIGA